ncbi:hypothetical protein KSP39_PZI021952 [Platanthera zijinensis]|uniref:Uncharacterized protein n=1 Tax=Platanthera zijinensis TaxID=2320716 RepID=A0AAP0FVR1_9ASPA
MARVPRHCSQFVPATDIWPETQIRTSHMLTLGDGRRTFGSKAYNPCIFSSSKGSSYQRDPAQLESIVHSFLDGRGLITEDFTLHLFYLVSSLLVLIN